MIVMTPNVASAHVVVPDTTGKTGAIFHVTPDDDPIAGATTGLYYELDPSSNLQTATATLLITSASGGISETVPATLKGQTVSASFDFPVRDLYYLSLSVVPADHSLPALTFNSSQRITHSSGANPEVVVPIWAKLGILASVWSLTLLFLTAIRRRRAIIKKSR
jgi:hypothetical protein